MEFVPFKDGIEFTKECRERMKKYLHENRVWIYQKLEEHNADHIMFGAKTGEIYGFVRSNFLTFDDGKYRTTEKDKNPVIVVAREELAYL